MKYDDSMDIPCCFFYNYENFFRRSCEILYMCNLHNLLYLDKINRNKVSVKNKEFMRKKCRMTSEIYQITGLNICFDRDFCFGNVTDHPDIAKELTMG